MKIEITKAVCKMRSRQIDPLDAPNYEQGNDYWMVSFDLLSTTDERIAKGEVEIAVPEKAFFDEVQAKLQILNKIK